MGINRAFIYGDLLFETIRFSGGELVNIDFHTKRIEQGAKLLGFDLPSTWGVNYLSDLILPQINSHNSRIRLVMSRQGEGFYLPDNNAVSFHVEHWALLPKKVLVDNIDVFEGQHKACNSLSNLKSGNALIYVLASQYAAANQLDDALIMNQHGRIAEATSSNVFWIKNGIIFTPPLTEGPVAGIMREVVIKKATTQGLMVQEMELTIEELLLADECFLTNALNGITLVNQFRDKKFEHELGSILQRDIK
jgi:branched-chain amino acid aminotransferase